MSNKPLDGWKREAEQISIDCAACGKQHGIDAMNEALEALRTLKCDCGNDTFNFFIAPRGADQ